MAQDNPTEKARGFEDFDESMLDSETGDLFEDGIQADKQNPTAPKKRESASDRLDRLESTLDQLTTVIAMLAESKAAERQEPPPAHHSQINSLKEIAGIMTTLMKPLTDTFMAGAKLGANQGEIRAAFEAELDKSEALEEQIREIKASLANPKGGKIDVDQISKGVEKVLGMLTVPVKKD